MQGIQLLSPLHLPWNRRPSQRVPLPQRLSPRSKKHLRNPALSFTWRRLPKKLSMSCCIKEWKPGRSLRKRKLIIDLTERRRGSLKRRRQ
ncbi:uncharacterized protein [Physcomitrium patens]|uniref:uncharacterized protein isoform X2 n=1 Tax=Physcomitrium patens TaxID=3218 RepID=UPI003CCD4592